MREILFNINNNNANKIMSTILSSAIFFILYPLFLKRNSKSFSFPFLKTIVLHKSQVQTHIHAALQAFLQCQ